MMNVRILGAIGYQISPTVSVINSVMSKAIVCLSVCIGTAEEEHLYGKGG